MHGWVTSFLKILIFPNQSPQLLPKPTTLDLKKNQSKNLIIHIIQTYSIH